jgi:hypothetical protein
LEGIWVMGDAKPNEEVAVNVVPLARARRRREAGGAAMRGGVVMALGEAPPFAEGRGERKIPPPGSHLPAPGASTTWPSAAERGFPCNSDRDNLLKPAREITDETARLHRGIRERGGADR